MELIVVKSNFQCFKKYITGISSEAETRLRSYLRVLSHPDSCVETNIQRGRQMKSIIPILISDVELQACLALRSVIQYIKSLRDEDDVVLLDANQYNNYDIFCWIQALRGKAKGLNPVEKYKLYHYDIPMLYFPRYDIYFYADFGYDQYFGEQDKNKRICRFCHKSGATIFGNPKNSHAISLFLGNQTLYCLEECKDCNNTFGKTIENALASYYQYYRAAEHRKSRNGKPLMAKGFNYEQSADGGLHIFQHEPVESALHVGESIPEEGLKIELNNSEPVVLHDIYRVLVKYVLACLPSALIPNFRIAADWVSGKKHPRKGTLPPIYRNETMDEVATPFLCVYIRRDSRKDLPYCVGELYFLENLYVFAIPYCKGYDVMNSYLSNPLAHFVEKRYSDIQFTIENYCDDIPRMVTNHVLLEGGKDAVLEPFSTIDNKKQL